jgi:hypothetical protein
LICAGRRWFLRIVSTRTASAKVSSDPCNDYYRYHNEDQNVHATLVPVFLLLCAYHCIFHLTTQDFLLLFILDALTSFLFLHHLQLFVFRTHLFIYHDSLSYWYWLNWDDLALFFFVAGRI